MSKTTQRTDPHRKGAIIPAQYEYVFSFNLATSSDGWPVPSYGINCALDRRTWSTDADGRDHCVNGSHDADGCCCVLGLHEQGKKFARHGSPGKCTVCGASFVYGDVWRHVPTQEHIFIGHDCASKYSLMADRSEYELESGRYRQAAAAQIARVQNAEERAAFLANYPGLDEALKGHHAILFDLARKFHTYRNLSEKQVALAFKLANELQNPKPEEPKVPAPTGKGLTIEGTVVSCKSVENTYTGMDRWTLTVKVETPEGCWLAWGTCPSPAIDLANTEEGKLERGDRVRLVATITATSDRDPSFAFYSRPRKFERLARAAELEPREVQSA